MQIWGLFNRPLMLTDGDFEMMMVMAFPEMPTSYALDLGAEYITMRYIL